MVMSGTRIGRWREDLLPRTHIMAERRVAKDSRHLSQPITVEYGFCCFPEIMSASRLYIESCHISLASHAYFSVCEIPRARAKGGRGRKNTYGVTRHIFVGTAGMLAAPIKFKRSHDIQAYAVRLAV